MILKDDLDSGQPGKNLSSEYLRNGSEADMQILSSAQYKASPPSSSGRIEVNGMRWRSNFLSNESAKCPAFVEHIPIEQPHQFVSPLTPQTLPLEP